jgi:lipoate-protein ligase A
MGDEPALPMGLGLLATTCLSGTWQMALDGALLERQQPMLRLYSWSRPTLSLGFHQRQLKPHWLDWQRRGQLDLVRRPSGGGAVLHGSDLCYALVLPCDRFGRQQAYGLVCGWLQQAMAALGWGLNFGSDRADGSPDCFARSTAADLVHADGAKRIGSAQRWQRGWLLQHGSIQLSPPGEPWRALLGSVPPPPLEPAVASARLADQLLQCARLRWDLPAAALPLDADLLADAGAQLERYRVPSTSPLASIALTT